MKNGSGKNKNLVPIIVGALLIVLGVLLNEVFIAKLFTDREILSKGATIVIRVFNGFCIFLGLFFIIYSSRTSIDEFSKNLLLTIVPLFLLYLLFELSFKFLLPALPLGLQPFVDESFRVISQSSKSQATPKNYIAVLGDSFAMGAGDWYLDANPRSNPPYSSSHIINEALNMDVVSFGKSGASSITGLIVQPINSLRKLRTRFEFDEPEIILVYFYEGNDLKDNVRDLQTRKPNYYQYTGLDSLNYQKFSEYIKNNIIAKPSFENFKTRLIGLRFLQELVSNYFRDKVPMNERNNNNIEKGTNYNMVEFQDSTRQLPGRLQSPSLELSNEEIRLGLQVFKFSLRFLAEQFPKSQIYVAYVPSVLSSYTVVGQVSVLVTDGRTEIYDKSDLYQRSNYIISEINESCQDLNIKFIDTGPSYMRQFTKHNILHGPKDWNHFNRLGYEIFSQKIIHDLK
ncbi:MAG: hypothetical protein DHS20C17_18720 [Cyclobacteriaceae bacterium]|nr:MAG: hypothetical protein DHS20C17_18720 [Cyclobacteriaceae bacterium]